MYGEEVLRLRGNCGHSERGQGAVITCPYDFVQYVAVPKSRRSENECDDPLRVWFLMSSSYRDERASSRRVPVPLYIHKSYFDVHPRPQTSPPPQSPPDLHPFHKKHSRRPTEQHRGTVKVSDSSFAFPTSDHYHYPSSTLSGSHLTPRARTRTGPSKRHDDPVPPSRLSGTSSLGDPPPTPNDISSFAGHSPLNFPVVVAAPIAGVETLDALVDGMNGMAGASMDDLFSRNTSHSRFGLSAHHPLYQPPLPTPPPGIVLGKGKGRRRDKPVTSDDDDDDDDGNNMIPTTKPPRSYPRHRHNPPLSSSREASTSTIAIDSASSDNMTPPASDFNDHTPINTVQPTERPRTIVPSISEIIRNHAPHTLERTRPPSVHSPGYAHRNGTLLAGPEEEESEPEPLTPDEEAELLSRSSMDSIEHEVRRTYNNQKNSHVTAPPLTSCHSNTSDASSIPLGVRAAPSDTYTHTSSTTSVHTSQQSFDPIHFSISPTSTSQAIAEYLRSARLTTLLKLTRYPHASLDHPLTVSLADMGDPNGFPLVVFLGLGCVRHIMGLYDEMADCLGLRLIAIDRYVNSLSRCL